MAQSAGHMCLFGCAQTPFCCSGATPVQVSCLNTYLGALKLRFISAGDGSDSDYETDEEGERDVSSPSAMAAADGEVGALPSAVSPSAAGVKHAAAGSRAATGRRCMPLMWALARQRARLRVTAACTCQRRHQLEHHGRRACGLGFGTAFVYAQTAQYASLWQSGSS